MQFGPGFLATFLYYFSTTAIVFALVSYKALGVGFDTQIPQQIGLLGGVLAGLVGGYFNRTRSFTVSYTNQKTFVAQLNDQLTQLGYQPQEPRDDVLVYERSALGKYLSGKVFVQLENGTATIASRSVQLSRIQKQLQ
ncbi:MAG: hypothetical protein HC881_06390 [Leptolyngbyaceae cyanobacterium SL_7_1]|nr:hypothetical protein [Leptolyngbyaceae cyanobacterium SL_7_1]